MERIAQVFRTKPGMVNKYAERHQSLWPELEQAFRQAGVSRYSIFAWGEVLISYMEVDDYRLMVRQLSGNPIAKRWESEFADLVEYPELDPETEWPPALREIWSLGP